MEEIYSTLRETGSRLEDAAHRGKMVLATNRVWGPGPEVGSLEYIEQLGKTSQFVAKTSFRRSNDAARSKTRGAGTKFENLGKTSFTLGKSSRSVMKVASALHSESGDGKGKVKTKHFGQIAYKSNLSRERSGKRGGKENLGSSSRPNQTRDKALMTDTGDDSSDELNLTSSSQPIEGHRRSPDPISDAKTTPSSSDSDVSEPSQAVGIVGPPLHRLVQSRESKRHSPKSLNRHDEIGFSDETPDKKKPKLKRRTRKKNSDDAEKGQRGRLGLSTEAATSARNEKRVLKNSYTSDPIKLMLEERSKEEMTPRPIRKSAEGKSQSTAPFPMAKAQMKGGLWRSFEAATSEACLTPFPPTKGNGPFSIAGIFASRAKDRRTKSSDDGNSESDDDPLLISRSEVVLRGGLAPFPMSSQDRPGLSSGNTSDSYRPDGSENDGSWTGNEEKRQDGPFRGVGEYSSSEPGEPVDPKTLCPYCDMPFPPSPSPLLLDMLKRIPKYPDARPTNPLGLKAPLLSYVSMCQRHEFEMQLLPTAKAAGWPTYIDFVALPNRIRTLRRRLADVLYEKNKSRFWHELKKDIDKQGVKKTMGISNQFDSFEKCQPGYYGEQGAIIIFQTLSQLFPPDRIDVDNLAPLTLTEFLRYVLVPECAAALIREDLGATFERAIRTLRESSKYGTAMFPDLDNKDATSISGASDVAQEVGNALFQERVRTRRREIDEEEQAKRTQESDKQISHACKQREEAPKEFRRNSGKPLRSCRSKDGIIELTDSASERTDGSVPERSRKVRKAKETTIDKTTQRPKVSTHAKLSDAEPLQNNTDEATPNAARNWRDSGIVLPDAGKRREKFSQKKASSKSGTRPKGTFQPLQVAKERSSKKDALFKRTMWDTADSEDDDSSRPSSRSDKDAGRGVQQTTSLTRTTSYSWLWSDPSTPASLPSS